MELLNDMALFVEVVNARSFRGAAAATGVPNSTLSRRVALLEKAIGLRLLHRTTRKVEPTEAGRLYHERCRRIVDEARIAHEQLGQMLAQPSGVLRVSLPVDFAMAYLAPLLVEFGQQYPGITFDLDLTPRRVDLVAEPFDVAIRVGPLPDSALIARQLARLSGHLYAAPAYLQRAGVPGHPAELARHECLCLPKANEWTLHHGGERLRVKVRGRFTLNNVGLLKRLAVLGQGIAQLTPEMVTEDLAAGRLQRVLPPWQSEPIAVHALTETRLLPAKTLRFLEFLQQRMAAGA